MRKGWKKLAGVEQTGEGMAGEKWGGQGEGFCSVYHGQKEHFAAGSAVEGRAEEVRSWKGLGRKKAEP